MMKPALMRTFPVARNAPSHLYKSSFVACAQEPIVLPLPGQVCPETGKLVLKKENGAVKGFEYQCVCGRRDHFICE